LLCFIENFPFVLSLSKRRWNKLTLPCRRRTLRQAQGERSFLRSNRDLFGRALEVRAEQDPFVLSLSKHRWDKLTLPCRRQTLRQAQDERSFFGEQP
jgi:hypothetical protein